jgi:uncharacterized protein (UPF0332 family)
MNAQHFLTLARALAAGNSEAEWRTAISRAYYATFHTARELLHDLGFVVPRDDSAHRYLIYRLNNGQHPSAERAGLDLDRLRSDRNSADYDLRSAVSTTIALRLIQVADRAMQALAGIQKEPVRSAVMIVMREYERDVLKMVTWRASP